MVRLLIRMRATMLTHSPTTRFGKLSILLTLLFSLALAGGTLLSGFAPYPTPQGGLAVLAAASALWFIGRLGYAAFAGGDATLRWELFRLLPVTRARLARSLLVVGLLDPGGVIVMIALCAVLPIGVAAGIAAAAVGVLGVLLSVVLMNIAVTVVGALQPHNGRRTRDTGTIVVALVISLVAVAGTTLPGLSAALAGGHARVIAWVGRALPSGWAADAIAGVIAGRPIQAVVPLAGLVAVTLVLVMIWPWLLGRRLDGRAGGHHSRRIRAGRRRLLPSNPVGAVVGKEMRLWLRDPIRATFLLIGLVVGFGVCVLPAVVSGTRFLMPFGGLLSAVIAVAGGANLVGGDGRALRLSVLTPGAIGAETTGRQLAWLLIVGPYALVLGALLTILSGQGWAWPWMLSLTLAALGAGSGLVPLASVTSVQPTDGSGGLTPAWVIKAYAAMLLTAGSAAVEVALLMVGQLSGTDWLRWLAVPVGGFLGCALAVAFARAASRRLRTHQFEILVRLELGARTAES